MSVAARRSTTLRIGAPAARAALSSSDASTDLSPCAHRIPAH